MPLQHLKPPFMAERLFKRKIYAELLNWKRESDGKSALLVEGARRVGKSTIVETFAKKEYESYLLIDFNNASKAIKDLFNDLMDLDYLFLYLQTTYHVTLVKRKSVIIFDEVQKCPMARQAIKYLVEDGRYDYIETGSLISIKKNTEGITIPSEEDRIQMNPMDFEEFRWALGDEATLPLLQKFWEQQHPLALLIVKWHVICVCICLSVECLRLSMLILIQIISARLTLPNVGY